MALYIGQTITVIVAATDPAHGNAVIADAAAEVEFYAPGKNPARNPDGREVDAGPFAMNYDETIENADGSTGAYVAFVDTSDAGFKNTSGKWAYKVTLSGSYDSWAYGSVTLAA